MRLTVIAVGRNRGVLAPAVREFETRAARYWKIEVIEVDSGTGGGGAGGEEEVRKAEARRVQARLPASGEVWALTREGEATSSEELARALGGRALRDATGVSFLIGGAFGLAADLVEGADRRLSLSGMTLPHAIARLVLAEQLYRAGTILRGEPYHKGTIA